MPHRTSFSSTVRERRGALLAIVIAATVAGALACNDTSGPLAPASTSGGQQAKNAAPITGDYVVRGTVLGVDSAGGGPWSAHPLAGVVLTVSQVSRPPGVDSSTTPPTVTTIGTVTSGADGGFELGNVPYGYFYLDAVPPASSGYRSGRAGSVSLPQGSSDRAFVYLYR